MSDLISKSNLLEIVEQTKRCLKPLNSDYMQGYVEALAGVEKVIELQPTVEVISKDKLDEIVERLKSKKKNICGSYFYATPTLETPSHKVAFNNGISEAIEIVKEVGGMNDNS